MTDFELLARLANLSKVQAEAECEIISDLVEVERRSLHLKKAYRSLFEFIRVHLKCSEATAARRVAVVKAAAKFPVVLDALRAQSVTLTSLAMIAPHLTEENHADILAKIAGVSSRDVEKLVASFLPSKPKRDMIRPVMVSVPEGPLSAEVKYRDIAGLEGEPLVLEAGHAETKREEKVRLVFDAPAELAKKIQRLKEIHAHKLKDGSLAEIIEMAVEMFLDKTAPERKEEPKKKVVKTPTAKAQAANVKMPVVKATIVKAPRTIKVEVRRPAAAIQRQVWRRDEGQCTFTDQDGKRCSAKSHIQIDHVRPWAFGGSSKDVENLRLLCRAHNMLMGERYFPGGAGRASRCESRSLRRMRNV